MMGKVPPFRLLDILRALAALWVLMLHTGHRVDSTLNPQLAHSFLLRVAGAGQLGVVVFFVISGYCIAAACYSALASGKPVLRYAYERARRIYPPYLAALLLAIVVRQLQSLAQTHHWLSGIHHTARVFPDTFLFWAANVLMLQVEGRQPAFLYVAWSLSYEVAYYIAMGLLLVLAKQREPRHGKLSGLLWFSSGAGALTAASFLWVIVSPGTCPKIIDRGYQFGLGVLFYLAVELLPARMPNLSNGPRQLNRILMLGALGLTGVLTTSVAGKPGEPTVQAQTITCLLLLVVLYLLRPMDDVVAQWKVLTPLFWLGSFSYSLYLVHLVLLEIFDTLLKRAHLAGDRYWMAYSLNLLLCLLASWLFYQAVEKHFISSRQKKRVLSEVSASVLV